MKIIPVSVLLALIVTPVYAFSDAVEALIEVGRGQAEIQSGYAQETKACERVKKGVDEGIVQKGTPKKEVLDRYGEPVIIYNDFDTKKETWVYKPAQSDFMGGGMKVRIYFDNNDAVDEVAVSEQTEEKK